jgi:hypothetical protein
VKAITGLEMKTYDGPFLTSEQHRGKWSVSCPGRINHSPRTLWTEG